MLLRNMLSFFNGNAQHGSARNRALMEDLLCICCAVDRLESGDDFAARRREAPHGAIANRLWSYIGEQAPAFVRAIG